MKKILTLITSFSLFVTSSVCALNNELEIIESLIRESNVIRGYFAPTSSKTETGDLSQTTPAQNITYEINRAFKVYTYTFIDKAPLIDKDQADYYGENWYIPLDFEAYATASIYGDADERAKKIDNISIYTDKEKEKLKKEAYENEGKWYISSVKKSLSYENIIKREKFIDFIFDGSIQKILNENSISDVKEIKIVNMMTTNSTTQNVNDVLCFYAITENGNYIIPYTANQKDKVYTEAEFLDICVVDDAFDYVPKIKDEIVLEDKIDKIEEKINNVADTTESSNTGSTPYMEENQDSALEKWKDDNIEAEEKQEKQEPIEQPEKLPEKEKVDQPKEEIINYILKFNDVSEAHWAYKEVGYLANKGIIQGYGNGYFGTDDSIIYNHLGLLLDRLFNYKAENTSSDAAIREDIIASVVKALGIDVKSIDESIIEESFSDCGDLKAENKRYIAAAIEKGLVIGSDGKLNPKSQLTRAETAVLLYRAINFNSAEEAPAERLHLSDVIE